MSDGRDIVDRRIPHCKVADRIELMKDEEGWFLRLYDIDGGYATLAMFPSKSEAVVVYACVVAVMRHGDREFVMDSCERLDWFMSPSRVKTSEDDDDDEAAEREVRGD